MFSDDENPEELRKKIRKLEETVEQQKKVIERLSKARRSIT
jgi:hypothetical protein